jgi:uncharacterized protein
MIYSRYNIFSRIKDSENFFILNLLTGNADILSPDEAGIVEALKNGTPGARAEFADELSEKGYITDEAAEALLYRNRYLDFIDSRDKDEIQIFFVTNYSCNFACSYCYQDQYNNPKLELSDEIIDAFFSYVNSKFAGRKKYITVFGGEPLLNNTKQKELISRIIRQASESGLEVSFVTNGYYLEEYCEILTTGKIREVQVTLDGTELVHNSRRFLKGGNGTFDKIVKGIDASLRKGIDINLRMVADKENINDLPDLALFAIDKGWTGNPLFKTQIGRNYELHHCQSAPDKLFDRISLYEHIFKLVKDHPYITEFYKPAYSVSKFLSENGELPDPLFDSCPACKTEWAFDYTGNIYSCTATVGKTEESLGTFYPSVSLNEDIVQEWEGRDVTAIKDCKTCSVQLACGGGCGSVAKNSNGSICSPDCRPVKELLELGFAAYIENGEIH